jgi:hypothetical protein
MQTAKLHKYLDFAMGYGNDSVAAVRGKPALFNFFWFPRIASRLPVAADTD